MALSQLINANTQNACLAEALRELATYIDNGQRTVNRFKAEAAQAEADLANATTAIESLQATIAQLTGQLTQLKSAKIAREDIDPIEPAIPMYPMPDGYGPVPIGATIQHGDMYLFMGQWQPTTRIGITHDGEGVRMCRPLNAPKP